jgi:serine/threonine-protein kinase
MSLRVCPTCGYAGDGAVCPHDGTELLTAEEAESTLANVEPTGAPPVVERRAHAPAAAPADEHEALRGEDFGKWAAPEVRRSRDPMVGRTIAGRYEVIGLIGQGGMGAVYKARQPAVQRLIALKILLAEFAENETIIKRFHQEALAASRLTHPNTIKVYDFGQTDDGVLYMAMEFLRGESLAQALSRGGAMPARRTLHIMRQVCKSLAEAHKAGIIHRDLKPDNIFLTEIEGEREFVKVLDFGVAKLREYEGKEGTLTQAGMIFGTPKYMSPEQARSADLDARSDVYALGVILYEMLMGKAPFTGDNPLSILIAHVNERPRRFQAFNPEVDVPAPLEAVVFKALQKDREDRHQSVEELLAELEACEELLQGVPYDRVADRLPQFAPGADGTPSLLGPGIVPEGSNATVPGRPGGRDGGTLALEGVEVPPVGDPSGADIALERRRGAGPWIAVALGVPVAAGLAWFFVGRTPTAVTPDAAAPASVARVVADAAAPASVAAGHPVVPLPDAAVAAEPPRPRPVEHGTELVITTVPDGVTVIEDATGEKAGVAKPALHVRIDAPTDYVLSKRGYLDQRVHLTPDQAQKLVTVKMKPAPVAEAAPPPPPHAPSEGHANVTVSSDHVAAPATQAPSKQPDITLQ